MQEYYSNRENCMTDLAQARKLFSNPKATDAQWDNLDKGLGLMFLYCPEDMQYMAEATIEEASSRRLHQEINHKEG